ncbi:hypoxia up-regulated protein 1-like isoform X2 [Haliotis rufescens]|uniref:hypoxia up-regulated protein 1-like isoform X2 n=1 Tax=Haliotis rufescens TaxID=6454 RepID=UPI00201E7DCB|nr:hypoxia up-regulated protein 1-like isoform X2 [Haliotis rufescens]
MRLGITVLGAVLCSFIGLTAGVAVMSIDLGAEFMKIAIVKPGVPMEIVTNRESSRKTRTLVAFRDGERQFANQAYTTSVRFPRKAFWYLTHVVGRHFDDPQVQLYKERFPFYDLVKDEERGTVLFRTEDGETTYTPEELLAMILESAREYAEEFGDHPIKDAVITVPAYFNQAERRAVKSAADMIGLNVLQLMSDNAAVALNYGVFRRKNFNSTMQYYIFYDMGATSTVATVVGYQVVKMKEGTRVETNPQVVIKGVGFDRTLGGLDVTLRLRNHLAKVFNEQKKTKNDVFKNERSMAKLLKEADRVKQVLSANPDHHAQVEGLLDENDFRAKVTREDLEELCEDFFPRVIKPIEEALRISEITMGEISEVILMGAATRMPKVQEQLTTFLKSSELGKSINTDESAAMGAVYQAAFLGKGFKVKTFNVKEGNVYPIVVEFEKHRTSEDGSESSKTVKRTLFGRMNPYPQKKVMTFNKHYSDFSFSVGYGDIDFLSDLDKKSFPQLLLSNVSLIGVEDAYKKHKEGAEGKGIKAHFRMDESGILHLDKVESVFEKVGEAAEEKDESAWSKIGSAIGGLFGGSDGKDKEAKVEDSDEPSESTEETTEPPSEQEPKQKEKTDEKTEDKTKEKTKDKKEKESDKKEKKEDKKSKDGEKEKDEKKKDEEPKKPKITTIKEVINSTMDSLDLPNLSKDRMKEAKKILASLKAKDKEKMELEKAKNELEAYIFDSQDKLSQDTYVKCSTESEREELNKLMSEASDWLYEQPDDAKKDVFIKKLKSLKDSLKDVVRRVFELEERPKALEALKSMLNHSFHFLKSVKNLTTTDDPIFTEVEVTTLETLINETSEWRSTNLKEQKKLKDYENPKMLVEDIALKIQALDREVKYLINKAKYWKPKTKPKTDDKKKTNSTDKATNETKSEESKTEKAESKTEKAESKTEKAESKTEKAESKTEKAESKTEEAESKTGKAESEPKVDEATTQSSESQEEAPKESKSDKSTKKENKKDKETKDTEEETLQIGGSERIKEEHTEL